MKPADYKRIKDFLPHLEEVERADWDKLIRESFADSPDLANKFIAMLSHFEPEAGEPMVLGNYEIDSKIADGGMSSVYKGHHITLDFPVAIKILAPILASDSSYISRFEHEARKASSINNPHIVGINDFVSDKNKYAIVMEYIVGKDLGSLFHDYKAQNPNWPSLPAAITLFFLEDVCNALQQVHKQGIIHRDLKPENILLDENGYFKIVDFGLARDIQKSDTRFTRTGVLLGTVAYMSPEQAAGRTDLDARSDIFSLGVIAYLFLSGNRPFRGDTEFRVIDRIIHHDPPSLERESCPDLTPKIQQMVNKMLAKDRSARYSTIEDLLPDLREAKTSLRSKGLLPEDNRDVLGNFLKNPVSVSNELRQDISISRLYRFGKSRTFRTALSLVFVLLVVLVGIKYWPKPEEPDKGATFVASIDPTVLDIQSNTFTVLGPADDLPVQDDSTPVSVPEPVVDHKPPSETRPDPPRKPYIAWKAPKLLTYQLNKGKTRYTSGDDKISIDPGTPYSLVFFDESIFAQVLFNIEKLEAGSEKYLGIIRFPTGMLEIVSGNEMIVLIDGVKLGPPRNEYDRFAVGEGEHLLQLVTPGHFANKVDMKDALGEIHPLISSNTPGDTSSFHFEIVEPGEYKIVAIFREQGVE